MNIKVYRLEEASEEILDKFTSWQYDSWGKDNYSKEQIKYSLSHSFNKDKKLPQTFVVEVDNTIAGMYQIAYQDDLDARPDLYPWLINAYIDPDYRGQGLFKQLMSSVKDNIKELGFKEIYLYTTHEKLYEKYGWNFIKEEPTFKDNPSTVRIYKLELN